jgi:hypothetical protein
VPMEARPQPALVLIPAQLAFGLFMGIFAQVIPFTNQTRLTFDVVLPLWGPRGPRPPLPSARAQRSPLC